jgi:hypothetical protein
MWAKPSFFKISLKTLPTQNTSTVFLFSQSILLAESFILMAALMGAQY